MAKNYNDIVLSLEDLLSLAETLDIAKPEPLTDEAEKKLKDTICKKIEDTEEMTVHEYIKAWKESSNVKVDTTSTTEEPVVTCTFASLAKKQTHQLEHTTTKRALKLVRVMISTNNPNKHNLKGEIITVQNAVMPSVKKFVPFNVPTHIPEMMFNVFKEKQMQVFYEVKLPNGRTKKKARLVPEYNIQVLPPLTAKELDAIKQKQLAENAQLGS